MALRQGEIGMPVKDICRQIGISRATYYRWKKNFKALRSSKPSDLRQLLDENRRLRILLADVSDTVSASVPLTSKD